MACRKAIHLRFLTLLAHEQKQMSLLRFGLHHGNVERFTQVGRHAEFKELTVTIAGDVITAKSAGETQVRRLPCRQRDAISRTLIRAPIAANLDSMFIAFIQF